MSERIRNEEIDILKGISIFLVVLGHTKFAGTHFIYLFHMAVFFMASGYFYRSAASDSVGSVWKTVKKRIKALWLPFVLWNTIYTVLTNVFIKLNIYTSNEEISKYVSADFVSIHKKMSLVEMAKNVIKGLFLAGHTELGGAFWFLRVLFYISVGYVLIDFVLKKLIKNEQIVLWCQSIISIVFLIVGYVMSLRQIDTAAIDLFCSCYCLYFIGMFLRKFENNISTLKPWLLFGVTVICFVALFVMEYFGTISLGNNSYVNPFFMIIASLLGWFMLLSVSLLLKNVSTIKKIFVTVGQNSLYIVLFHFLAFKIVSLIIAVSTSKPLFTVAAFPVVTNEGMWWILYAFVGTIVPVGLGLLWQKMKSKIQMSKV